MMSTTYLIEKHDLERLQSVSTRLYNGTKLSYDDRRDMAYIVGSICETIEECPVDGDSNQEK